MNRTDYGRESMRMNRRFEKIFFPKVKSALASQVSRVTNVVRNNGIDAGIRYLLTNETSNPALYETLMDLYKVVGIRNAQRVTALLNKEPAVVKVKRLSYNADWVQIIVDLLQRFALEKLTFSITQTTREAMIRTLQQTVDDGLGITEATARLRETGLADYRIARIVRTEVKRASEVGGHAGSETFEFEQNKEWIAITDNRTRGNPKNGQHDHSNHYSMNGQTVDADGRFVDPRNGHELKFPGDPEADAEDVINCRCTVAYVAKRDSNGRMIKKNRGAGRVVVIRNFNRQNRVVTI